MSAPVSKQPLSTPSTELDSSLNVLRQPENNPAIDNGYISELDPLKHNAKIDQILCCRDGYNIGTKDFPVKCFLPELLDYIDVELEKLGFFRKAPWLVGGAASAVMADIPFPPTDVDICYYIHNDSAFDQAGIDQSELILQIIQKFFLLKTGGTSDKPAQHKIISLDGFLYVNLGEIDLKFISKHNRRLSVSKSNGFHVSLKPLNNSRYIAYCIDGNKRCNAQEFEQGLYELNNRIVVLKDLESLIGYPEPLLDMTWRVAHSFTQGYRVNAFDNSNKELTLEQLSEIAWKQITETYPCNTPQRIEKFKAKFKNSQLIHYPTNYLGKMFNLLNLLSLLNAGLVEKESPHDETRNVYIKHILNAYLEDLDNTKRPNKAMNSLIKLMISEPAIKKDLLALLKGLLLINTLYPNSGSSAYAFPFIKDPHTPCEFVSQTDGEGSEYYLALHHSPIEIAKQFILSYQKLEKHFDNHPLKPEFQNLPKGICMQYHTLTPELRIQITEDFINVFQMYPMAQILSNQYKHKPAESALAYFEFLEKEKFDGIDLHKVAIEKTLYKLGKLATEIGMINPNAIHLIKQLQGLVKDDQLTADNVKNQFSKLEILLNGIVSLQNGDILTGNPVFADPLNTVVMKFYASTPTFPITPAFPIDLEMWIKLMSLITEHGHNKIFQSSENFYQATIFIFRFFEKKFIENIVYKIKYAQFFKSVQKNQSDHSMMRWTCYLILNDLLYKKLITLEDSIFELTPSKYEMLKQEVQRDKLKEMFLFLSSQDDWKTILEQFTKQLISFEVMFKPGQKISDEINCLTSLALGQASPEIIINECIRIAISIDPKWVRTNVDVAQFERFMLPEDFNNLRCTFFADPELENFVQNACSYILKDAAKDVLVVKNAVALLPIVQKCLYENSDLILLKDQLHLLMQNSNLTVKTVLGKIKKLFEKMLIGNNHQIKPLDQAVRELFGQILIKFIKTFPPSLCKPDFLISIHELILLADQLEFFNDQQKIEVAEKTLSNMNQANLEQSPELFLLAYDFVRTASGYSDKSQKLVEETTKIKEIIPTIALHNASKILLQHPAIPEETAMTCLYIALKNSKEIKDKTVLVNVCTCVISNAFKSNDAFELRQAAEMAYLAFQQNLSLSPSTTILKLSQQLALVSQDNCEIGIRAAFYHKLSVDLLVKLENIALSDEKKQCFQTILISRILSYFISNNSQDAIREEVQTCLEGLSKLTVYANSSQLTTLKDLLSKSDRTSMSSLLGQFIIGFANKEAADTLIKNWSTFKSRMDVSDFLQTTHHFLITFPFDTSAIENAKLLCQSMEDLKFSENVEFRAVEAANTLKIINFCAKSLDTDLRKFVFKIACQSFQSSSENNNELLKISILGLQYALEGCQLLRTDDYVELDKLLISTLNKYKTELGAYFKTKHKEFLQLIEALAEFNIFTRKIEKIWPIIQVIGDFNTAAHDENAIECILLILKSLSTSSELKLFDWCEENIFNSFFPNRNNGDSFYTLIFTFFNNICSNMNANQIFAMTGKVSVKFKNYVEHLSDENSKINVINVSYVCDILLKARQPTTKVLFDTHVAEYDLFNQLIELNTLEAAQALFSITNNLLAYHKVTQKPEDLETAKNNLEVYLNELITKPQVGYYLIAPQIHSALLYIFQNIPKIEDLKQYRILFDLSFKFYGAHWNDYQKKELTLALLTTQKALLSSAKNVTNDAILSSFIKEFSDLLIIEMHHGVCAIHPQLLRELIFTFFNSLKDFKTPLTNLMSIIMEHADTHDLYSIEKLKKDKTDPSLRKIASNRLLCEKIIFTKLIAQFGEDNLDAAFKRLVLCYEISNKTDPLDVPIVFYIADATISMIFSIPGGTAASLLEKFESWMKKHIFNDMKFANHKSCKKYLDDVSLLYIDTLKPLINGNKKYKYLLDRFFNFLKIALDSPLLSKEPPKVKNNTFNSLDSFFYNVLYTGRNIIVKDPIVLEYFTAESKKLLKPYPKLLQFWNNASLTFPGAIR